MKFLLSLFRPRTAEEELREQLAEAERRALEHFAAGEHHMALAAMYRQRADRLRQQSGLLADVPKGWARA